LTEKSAAAADRTGSWLAAILVYMRPSMLSMLALGFSSGLPFLLIYSTLSAWLRQRGVSREMIGTLSLVGLAYSFKFLWSPIVDRLRLPLIGRLLGQRRSWMLMTQVLIAIALFAIASIEPADNLRHLVLITGLLAVSAATQDIVIDAWRIETASLTEQGPMAAAYQLGYRLSLIVSQAGALWIAGAAGWHTSYAAMGACAGIGILTTLLVKEPERRAPLQSVMTERRVVEWLEHRAHWPARLQHAGAWILGAVVCPILDFFARYGWSLGLLLFAFIASYRVTDYAMGVMSNTFMVDMHYTLQQMATIAKVFGVLMSVLGVIVGGVAIARLGRVRSLVLGGCLIICSNIAYSVLASHGQPSLPGLAIAAGLDYFAQGVHGTALIAFMSSLTSAGYTATQYAVLSSAYSLPGKLIMSRSGYVVTALGFPSFYLYTASLSIPALLLLWLLSRRRDFKRLSAEASATSGPLPAQA
jgi:PAT family beta-lactamase induction signal transducer AmpG